MMKLKNLVCNTDQVANELLKNWEHDGCSLTFWRGSSNYVYFFTNKNKKYWLRFSKRDENSLEQINGEIEFILYLNNNNFPSVYPIKSKNHKYVEVVEIELETYYAVVFINVDGVNLDICDMSELQFQHWGKTLASLHSLSKSYSPKEYVRKSWKDMLNCANDILSNFPNEKSAMEELNRIEIWLNSLPITNENYGLIHYDFELDNIFWIEQSNEFDAIDFDDCMYHWYTMDIAYALRDLDELENHKAESALQSFLKGYNSVISIEEEYIKLLPKFKRFGNLLSFTKLLRSLQDSNFSQEPVWLQRLKPRLLIKCVEYREGFEKAW